MTDSEDLMSIGQFSRLTRISIRMLRHYDEHRVLSPAEVDDWTGRRRYSPGQADLARRIRQLRDVGFGVSAIGALLSAEETVLRQALLRQRHELLAEHQLVGNRLALIDTLIEQGEPTVDYRLSEVTVRTRPQTSIVALRGIIPSYSEEGRLWEKFMPELARQHISAAGPGGVLEHKDHYQESDVDTSVWIEVDPATTCEAPLERIDLPAERVAEVRLTGAYQFIGEAVAAVIDHCQSAGLRVNGPAYNVYLSDPSQTETDQNLTTVGIPVTER